MLQRNQGGRCRSCGAELIDWERVHSCNLADVAYTFSALKQEMIRHHFWHKEIDEKALNYARGKGRQGIREAALRRIRTSVGPAQPPFDGRQTGNEGNVLYYAQHAMATCCRKCIEEWHGIPRGRELTEDEVYYLSTLVILFVEERLPWLPEQGENVPRASQAIRKIAVQEHRSA